MSLIVSISGVRGIVGESLTPQVALAFAQALGVCLGGGSVVISRDGRPSGMMLRYAIQAGLTAAGCDLLDLGVAPTPTVGLAIRTTGSAGGIQITASHNPAPYNGLKLFGRDGQVLGAKEGAEVKAQYDAGAARCAPWDRIGTARPYRQAEEAHADLVLRQIDVGRVRSARFKALLDANGGAGGPLGLRLLQSLAVEVEAVHCEPDGLFRHPPEPTEESLREVCPRVRQAGADIGLALDPDSDRLALIDEKGRYIGEELTLALAVLHRLKREKGPVVVNMSSSRVTEDIAARFGCECHRAAVGEANVAARMREVGAVLGGEGNGGVIDPRIGYVRDPFAGMALALSLMAETGLPLSQLVAELPRYVIVKDRHEASPEALPALYQALRKRWPEAKANTLDGLRLDWPDRWVHVRPSNTEPIVRVIAEAPDEASARALCAEVGQALQPAPQG
jgi:phosphomannomutase